MPSPSRPIAWAKSKHPTHPKAFADELPEVVELFARIASLLPSAVSFNDVVFRSTSTRYASEADFLSGQGAAMFGGRWNRRGIVAVYASLDVVTATYEAYHNFIEAGFPAAAIRPRVMAGAKARLSAVCDMTDGNVRRKLGFSLNDLLQEDWLGIQETGEESWTQAIGRGCRAAGFEGLIVPSARRRTGKNVVIFPDRLRPDSFLALIAPDDLPPHPRDWPG